MKQNRILLVLFATLLLDMIGLGMLIPVIPSLFTDPTSPSFLLQGFSVGAQYLIAGLITALFGLMQFIAAPILGELSDLYGRKKLLAIGVGVLAIANLVFAMGIAITSITVLLISRLIAGIAGANFSIAQAIIADVTQPEDRAKNFGIIGSAFGLGFIFGPLLGGWLAGASGNPALPFIVAGVLGIINVLSVTLFLHETHIVNTSVTKPSLFTAFHNIRVAWNDVDVRPIYFATFFVMLGFVFYTAFISIYLVKHFNFTETDTGLYFAIVGLWIVFTQGFVVRLVNGKYAERTILFYALPVLALTIFLQPFLPQIAYLYALMPLMAISFGLVTTNLPALVSKGVSSDKQGAALGINGSLQALTQGLAPLGAGLIAGVFGLSVSFVIGALFVVVAFMFVRTIPIRNH